MRFAPPPDNSQYLAFLFAVAGGARATACHARNLAAVLFPRSEESARRWAEADSRRQPEDHHFRFVIENKTGEVVGDLTTHHCDARVGTFAYGISIRHDQRGKGYAKEAIRLVLHYYFR